MSNSQIVVGSSPSPALSTVCTDQVTIRGSGTQYDPLHASGENDLPTVVAEGSLTPGMAIHANTFGGVAHGTAAKADAISSSSVVGLALTSNTDDDGVHYQSTGIVTLTADEWDAVITGSSGGLAPGFSYYVSDATAGFLAVRSAIVTSGHFLAQVGIALSATEIQMQLSAPIAIP
jgi:hypothetical protein